MALDVEPRIFSKTILLQYEVSRAFGVPEDRLEALDLRQDTLHDPDASIPGDLVYAHLELCAKHLDPARFGAFVVALATEHQTTTLGLPGFATRTAPTVREGLAVLHRYQHLTNTLASFDLVEQGDVARLTEHRFGAPRQGHLLATDVSMMVSVQIARELGGGDLTPTAVELRTPGPVPEAYLAHARCPIHVGAPDGALTFPRRLLDRALPTANEDMRAYFATELDRRDREARARPPVVLELRRVLADQLVRGLPSLASTATALATSARTLQRRLSNEGTTFAEVLEDVRRDLAKAYLHNPQYTAAEVAFLLGYSETSSFFRAFRRWTGTTPEAYRRDAQNARPSKR